MMDLRGIRPDVTIGAFIFSVRTILKELDTEIKRRDNINWVFSVEIMRESYGPAWSIDAGQ